jgi:hypothetical protein
VKNTFSVLLRYSIVISTMCMCVCVQVKFFERKKVTRSINKVEKQIANSNAEGERIEELSKQKAALMEDLAVSRMLVYVHFFDADTTHLFYLSVQFQYIMYFPKASKYISLFVDKEEGGKDKKTLAQMSKARAAALQAWAASKQAGVVDEDRVAYAMEVEHQGGGGGAGKTASGKKSGQVTLDESDSDSDSDSEGEREVSVKRVQKASRGMDKAESSGSGSGEDSGGSGSDSESEDERPVSNKKIATSDSSGSGSDSDSSDSESDNQRSSKDNKPKKDIAPMASEEQENTSGSGSYEPDPFFLEEDDGMDTHEIREQMNDRHDHGSKWQGGGARDRGGHRTSGRGSGGGKGAGGRRGGGGKGAGGKEPTKQEARLAKWQSKQSASSDAPADSSASNAWKQPSHEHSERSNKRKFNDSNGGGFNKSVQREGGGGKGVGGRGGGGKGGGGRGGGGRGGGGGKGGGKGGGGKGAAPTLAPKAAWEEGGGVSAKYVTAMSQSKLSGGIVTGAASNNKKIKFD